MKFFTVILLLAASQFSQGFLVWLPRPPRREESSDIPGADYEDEASSRPDINYASEQGTLNIQQAINDTLQDIFQIFANYQQRSPDNDGSRDYGSQLKEAIVGLVVDQFVRKELSNDTNSDVDLTQMNDENNEDRIAQFELSKVVSTSIEREKTTSGTIGRPNTTVSGTGGAPINIFSVLNETYKSTPHSLPLQRSNWLTGRIRSNIGAVESFISNDTTNSTTSKGIYSSEETVDIEVESRNASSHDSLNQPTSPVAPENMKELNDTMTTVRLEVLIMNRESTGAEKRADLNDKMKWLQESAMGETSEESEDTSAGDDYYEQDDVEERKQMIIRAHRYDTL